jgi:hypothetical protein
LGYKMNITDFSGAQKFEYVGTTGFGTAKKYD